MISEIVYGITCCILYFIVMWQSDVQMLCRIPLGLGMLPLPFNFIKIVAGLCVG